MRMTAARSANGGVLNGRTNRVHLCPTWTKVLIKSARQRRGYKISDQLGDAAKAA
jgi:hypothetical protein